MVVVVVAVVVEGGGGGEANVLVGLSLPDQHHTDAL